MRKLLIALCLITVQSFAFDSNFEMEILGAYLYQDQNENSFNIGNRVLEIPEHSLLTDTRAEFKLSFENSLRFVARPRFLADYRTYELTLPDESLKTAKGKADLTDLYIDFVMTEKLGITIGLHSYQWGPGEFFSPSNPIFHFETNQKGFLYKEKGKVLVRANFSPSQSWTLVGMSEVLDNREANWTAEESFEVKNLVKIEKQFQNAANYIGFTGGTESKSHPFLGEYLNWTPLEGYSLYLDAKHTKGAHFYQPEQNSFGFWDMVLAEEQKNQVFTLALLGFRFEDNFDLRFEYIYNSLGFDSTKMDQAFSSAGNFLSPLYRRNIERFSRTGLELLGREYFYLSVRVPNRGPKSDVTLALRSIYSKQDSSSQNVFYFEKPISDAVVGSIELSQSLGRDISEFALAEKTSLLVGAKWSL